MPPSKQQVAAAYDKTIADVISTNLSVLFVGINPSLYSAATGHHFARPGNRFWPALHKSKFTSRLMSPYDDQSLIDFDCGITNLVARATARADELSSDELFRASQLLSRKVKKHRPKCVAFVGITAYRQAFNLLKAKMGLQDHVIGEAIVWALPNPSGLNAHYQLSDFTRLFGELRHYVKHSGQLSVR